MNRVFRRLLNLNMTFYAVRCGRKPGVYMTWYLLHFSTVLLVYVYTAWFVLCMHRYRYTKFVSYIMCVVSLLKNNCIWRPECERLVKGFPKARFKKFSTESDAWEFVHGRETGMYLEMIFRRIRKAVLKLLLLKAMHYIVCCVKALM